MVSRSHRSALYTVVDVHWDTLVMGTTALNTLLHIMHGHDLAATPVAPDTVPVPEQGIY
jgi:hypothetical protein